MRPQIEAFQNIQRFDHGGALAPEAGLINLVSAIVGGDRLFRLQLECRHVFISHQAVVGLHEGVDAVRDFAAIEEIADGVDGGHSAGPAASAFFSAAAMDRSVLARLGWRKISPGIGTWPFGMKVFFESGHRSKKRRERAMDPARISSMARPSASSMAG